MRALIKSQISILLLLILCTAQITFAELHKIVNREIEGVWEGTLNAQGAKLRLVVHITTGKEGKLKAEMDSPDQGAQGIPVDEIKLVERELFFEMKSIGGKYRGMLSEDGSTINGTWSQGGSYTLVLKKDPSQKPREIKERSVAEIDPAIYKDYTGRYQLNPGFILTVSARDNRLFVRATAQPELEVFPESETKFFYKAVNAQITFVRNDNGAVEKMILHQHGQDIDAKKLEE